MKLGGLLRHSSFRSLFEVVPPEQLLPGKSRCQLHILTHKFTQKQTVVLCIILKSNQSHEVIVIRKCTISIENILYT